MVAAAGCLLPALLQLLGEHSQCWVDCRHIRRLDVLVTLRDVLERRRQHIPDLGTYQLVLTLHRLASGGVDGRADPGIRRST